MSKSTRNPDEKERHERIDKAIDESIEPSPDSARSIAELLDEQHTLVNRRLQKRFKKKGGRWIWKGKDE